MEGLYGLDASNCHPVWCLEVTAVGQHDEISGSFFCVIFWKTNRFVLHHQIMPTAHSPVSGSLVVMSLVYVNGAFKMAPVQLQCHEIRCFTSYFSIYHMPMHLW